MTDGTGDADPPDSGHAPVLELVDVQIAFTRRHLNPLTVVNDYNLRLHPGALHCISGRSGSGKTSLLRVAVALAAPHRGHVRWYGQRIDKLDGRALAAARRGRVSFVDQDATVLPDLTAADNVLLPAIPDGIDTTTETRAAELLELFGLHRRAKHRADTLSGGERQRLALARALLLRPGFVVVDEPTSSLDRASADTVINALRVVAREGAAVLVATHDPGLIANADAEDHLD